MTGFPHEANDVGEGALAASFVANHGDETRIERHPAIKPDFGKRRVRDLLCGYSVYVLRFVFSDTLEDGRRIASMYAVDWLIKDLA